MKTLVFALLFTSLGCAAAKAQDYRISKFMVSAPTPGTYAPWRDSSENDGRFFAGEIIIIHDTSFRYGNFSDDLDTNYPPDDFTGKLSVFKDHIFLNHPGVPYPYRIAGKADGTPVLMTWKAHEQWKKTGKVSHGYGDILFLEKKNKSPGPPIRSKAR